MSGRGLLLGAVVAVVAVIVVATFFVLDSPGLERRRRLDEERVRNLHEIADGIDAYWSRQGGLPPSLDALAEWQRLKAPPADPLNGSPYRYRATGEETYELCAGFATQAVQGEVPGVDPRQNFAWNHPAGDHCFELKAEKQKP